MARVKKGILNIISGGLALGGETSNAREVYACQFSEFVVVGKRPREEGKVVISLSELEMEHVTCPHDDALVMTTKIDGYDVKTVMIDSCSFTDVLFLDTRNNMGKSEKELKKLNFHLMEFTSTPLTR